MSDKYIPSLNGLRAVSIIIVIIHHLSINYFPRLGIVYLSDGQFGVNVFFVISGYLITTLLLNEESKNGKIDIGKFYIRRLLRIFPAYYFLLFVYFLLSLRGLISITPDSWLTALTFTKFYNWDGDWYTSHGWSLSIEEHFYFIWPLTFARFPGNRLKVIIAFIFIPMFVRTFIYIFHKGYANFYELTIFTRIDSIAIGCLFALKRQYILEKIANEWNKLMALNVLCLIVIGVAPLAIAKYKLHLGFFFLPLGTTHGTIANLAIAFCMFYFIYGPKNVAFRILNSKPLNFIGTISFSLYLWQQLFSLNNGNFPNRFPINLIFIFLASCFSYYLVEKPFLRLKSRLPLNSG